VGIALGCDVYAVHYYQWDVRRPQRTSQQNIAAANVRPLAQLTSARTVQWSRQRLAERLFHLAYQRNGGTHRRLEFGVNGCLIYRFRFYHTPVSGGAIFTVAVFTRCLFYPLPFLPVA